MTTEVALTGPQERALRVLASVEEYEWPEGSGVMHRSKTHPRAVAMSLWPDSEAWRRRTRRYGSNHPGQAGGTMPMKAATLLWRLHGHGLADKPDMGDNGWVVTEKGLRHLEALDGGAP